MANLTVNKLELAIHDCEWRIGSHIAITGIIDDYVLEQKRKIVEYAKQLNELYGGK